MGVIMKRNKVIILIVFVAVLLVSTAVRNVLLNSRMLHGKTIVIDPGHGGVDGGANNSEIKEKDVNLDVALRLRKKLEASGARVVMTRTEDVALSKSKELNRQRYREDLNARLNIINNSSADIFISIHVNSNINKPSTRGMIAFYYNSHPHNRSMAYIFQDIFNTYGFSYKGVEYKSYHIPQKGKYYLLVNSKIPGIIVETGFITNSTDLALLKKSDYREYIADAIYRGINSYFEQKDNLPYRIDDTGDDRNENMINMWDEDIKDR